MLTTQPIEELQRVKGVPFPADVRFRQLLVTGPPGAGKTTLVNKIGGWSEEGYVDVSTKNWWQSQVLSMRPREIHLGFPFANHDNALAVYDSEWLKMAAESPLDLERIRIPPEKRFFFSVDWRSRYVFEFVLPDAWTLYERRKARARRGTHPVDENLTLEQVEQQLVVFHQAALHLVRAGVRAYVRHDSDALPSRILESSHRAYEHKPLIEQQLGDR